MPGFLELCEKYFKTRDIYEVLGISKDASDAQVRKAYHKISLQVHPDRVDASEKKECTEKFKIVGQIHTILSDSDKRALYDETGDIGEDDLSERNWTKYWRLLFKKITLQDIKDFEARYKGSEEELGDLRKAYMEGEGDMDYILDTVLFATLDDEPRLKELLQNMIDENEIPGYPKFTNESQTKKKNRKRKLEKEAEEAEQMKQEMGLGDKESDLFALIRKKKASREQEMNSFYDSLAEKYGGNKKAKKTKADKASGEKPKANQANGEKPKAVKVKAEKPEANQPKSVRVKAAKPGANQPKTVKVKAEKPEANQPKANIRETRNSRARGKN